MDAMTDSEQQIDENQQDINVVTAKKIMKPTVF